MITISEIKNFLNNSKLDYEYLGNDNVVISGFSSIGNYSNGNITWIKKKAALNDIQEEDITLAVVQHGVETNISNVIYSHQSKAVFFGILEHFFQETEELPAVGSGTYISPKVIMGKNVIIGHNCTIDGDVKIGDGTRIYNNVSIINRARIGKNCIIQSGVSIGHDGFGYTEDDNHQKTMVKHYGGTEIGDNVYIGANSCVERGTIDNTVIGDGVKVDMLCLIGHNSVIEENSAIVGGTMILGSVRLSRNAYIASALIRNQCGVGENAFVGLGSVVTQDVPDNTVVAGVPAKQFKREE